MSLIHDTIKIKFIKAGYLPNYPYHMISDSEMCDAFLHNEAASGEDTQLAGFFVDMYPCPDTVLHPKYFKLVDAILYHIQNLKQSNSDTCVLPDWVYSYMLGSVIGPSSNSVDIHDLLVLLDLDNLDDVFTSDASARCYIISEKWLKKLPESSTSESAKLETIDSRPPTIFGEPHVIKSLRLSQSNARR